MISGRRGKLAARDASKSWGVQCAGDEIVWVDDEAAALRLLSSLIGAQRVVHRAEEPGTPVDRRAAGPEADCAS